MSFIENITWTIKSPRKAMDTIAEQPMIEEAVMIVGIYAVLSALNALLMSDKITYVFEGMDNIPSSMQSIITIAGVVSALIMSFLVWVVGTGILHFLSLLFGGEGKFYPQMMTVTAFGMIPLLFGSIISFFLLSMAEPMTITISASNPQATREIFDDPYLFASSMVGTVFQIWGAAIIFFGLQRAHRLAPVKSAIAVGIPLIIALVISLWNVV